MGITLSATQEEVVNYKDGNLLVMAGAGSGKTRVLTERIRKTIEELSEGQKVLAITFSNKAADELRERLYASIGEEQTLNSVYVGTIHNFCLEVVSSRGSLIGLPNELHIFDSFDDRLKIFTEAIENIPELKDKIIKKDPEENQKTIKELLNKLSNAKRSLKFSEDYKETPLIKMLFDEYDRLLLSQGAIDFDDILRYAYKIFNDRDSITALYRRIYKHIFVDESQDLNKAQYEIIKVLSGQEIILTLVGDPNQSIYGFNGSSSQYMEKIYLTDFNPKVIELNENFRSSKKIIEAAKRIESSFEIEGVCQFEGEFEIKRFDSDEEEALWIAGKIKELITNGHDDVENKTISLEQCIVIARNRYIFKALEELLNKDDISYNLKISSNNSFPCESDFVKAFILGIKLIVNSKDKIHFNQLTSLLNLDENDISFIELVSKPEISKEWQHLWNELRINWKDLMQNSENVNLNVVINNFKKFLAEGNSKIGDHEGIIIYEDLNNLNEIWNIFVKKTSPGERSLSNFIRSVSLGISQVYNERGLTLSTVHMSKGLEFDVVFVMGLNQGVFPDYRTINNEEQFEEEKHNMFVAITRSKRLCYLTYPIKRKTPWGIKNQIPSDFIKMLEN